MRWLVILIAVLGLARHARADDDAVALLPLDADAKLELYSQSVASEVARALASGQIDVVIVGPKMAVPTKARLIVDGTITGKGEQITLTLRIRDARAGTVLATLPATAGSVSDATEQLSGKVLPAVRAQIEALHAQQQAQQQQPEPPRVDHRLPRPKAEPSPVLLVVHGAATDPLAGALSSEFQPWAHRPVRPLPNTLVDMLGPTNTTGYDVAIGFEVLNYATATLKGDIPSARARVRVRVLVKGQPVFDRVVRTDTVVGDKGIASDVLAARTAREVLAIARPHIKRAVPTW